MKNRSPFLSGAALASILVIAASAAAQAPDHLDPVAATASNTQKPVSIDVEVTDKLGHPITGLQTQDFTLLDNKQPAKILSVRNVDTRGNAADPVHVMIVIDSINTRFDVVAREREQLTEFLKQDSGHLAHPTSLAVLTETGMEIEKNATTDGNLLATSLHNNRNSLRLEGRSAGFYGAADRLQWSLNQLTELAAYEAHQPGRKLVFFISPGWPLLPAAGFEETDKDRQWTFNAIVQLTNSLRESRVALYTLDPFHLGRTDVFFYQTYLKGVSKPNDAEYADLGLQVLATHTGGTVQVNGMDIKGEIDNAIRDAGSYYALTFAAPPADHRNEYHDLRVNLDKPGVKVRTTTGYYANPTTTTAHP